MLVRFDGPARCPCPGNDMRPRRTPTSFNMKVLAVVVAICGLVFLDLDLSPNRVLQEVTKKCDVIFNHKYSQYSEWKYWEGLYSVATRYGGNGLYVPSAIPEDLDPNNVGYVVTLLTCPADSFKDSSVEIPTDPGHAFYDAAAVLKYSILRSASITPGSETNYGATLYAIVHQDAVRCKGPDGIEYDRVKVLQELGYHVNIAGSPFGPAQIIDSGLREKLDDSAFRELIRLFAFDYTWHRVIVMIDFTTVMLRPIDDIYDHFLGDDDALVEGTYDYPDSLPFIGGNMGLNFHFFMLKPSASLRFMIIDAYKNATYSDELGWDKKGIGKFEGALGMKGFLRHFFVNVAPKGSLVTIDRCEFAYDNGNPTAWDGDEFVCLDEGSCDDCRPLSLEKDVSIIKMLGACGAPWTCSVNPEWDEITAASCAASHLAWFSTRVEFEESCWKNGPASARTGQFHTDIFRGFCTGSGITHYKRMIDDASSIELCDASTQTVETEITVLVGPAKYQDQVLELITGAVTGSVTACASGSITHVGVDGMKGKIINFGIIVNGKLQGGVDKSNVRVDDDGYKFGKFVITDLDPSDGKVNEVTASLTLDYDGDITTTSDQVTFNATAKISGTLA